MTSTIDPTAVQFAERLLALAVHDEAERARRYEGDGAPAPARRAGVRMRDVFALAKEFIELPVGEIELLLEHPVHEVKVGAVSVMDKQARRKRTTPEHRRALYELYLRRIDRIDNWDLVDLGAPHVVGGYLASRSRAPLYELARSSDPWQRRTAVVSTLFYVRQGDVDDTFALAEILRGDGEHLVQTAVGGLLREAGRREPARLLAFLDRYAGDLPKTALRYAMEHLDPATRKHYRALAATSERRSRTGSTG